MTHPEPHGFTFDAVAGEDVDQEGIFQGMFGSRSHDTMLAPMVVYSSMHGPTTGSLSNACIAFGHLEVRAGPRHQGVQA